MNKRTAYITGESYYSMTTKKNTKGKYASNCYEVGVKNPEIDDDNSAILEEYSKSRTDDDGNGYDYLHIKNSKFEIPMFDMNNKRMPEAVAIPNGTNITMFVQEEYNANFDTNYLVCKAIRVNEEIKEFNPFA